MSPDAAAHERAGARRGGAAVPVVVAGAGGRLGSLACAWIREAPDLVLAAELRRGDDAAAVLAAHAGAVLLDVTLAEASRVLVPLAIAQGVHPVVGTSGWDADALDALERSCAAAGLGALWVPNFSLGAVLQMRAAAEAARWLAPTSIHEAHHPAKRDAPSGTARATAARLAAASGGPAPPIRSERREGVLAEQHVRLDGPHESLELAHVVRDRRAYAPGVLLALRRVRGLSGLVRGLEPLL